MIDAGVFSTSGKNLAYLHIQILPKLNHLTCDFFIPAKLTHVVLPLGNFSKWLKAGKQEKNVSSQYSKNIENQLTLVHSFT